tara:strand:- start:808 stop:1686 length:879 start_codon:yes stop_codon:yes gene_type:complete
MADNENDENIETDETEKEVLISPVANILAFVAFTLLYLVVQMLMPGLSGIFLIIYTMLIYSMQILINMKNSKIVCGETKGGQAMLWAVLPYTLILGVIMFLMRVVPGIKKPFANTFGFLIISLLGIKPKFQKLLVKRTDDGSGDSASLVDEVYDNPSLLINEITPKNFTFAMQKLAQSKQRSKGEDKTSKLLPRNILDTSVVTKEIIEEFDKRKSPNVSKELNAVYKLVKMKDMIAEFIWLVLSGIFACTVAYNSILEINCSKTYKQAGQLAQSIQDASEKKDEEEEEEEEV